MTYFFKKIGHITHFFVVKNKNIINSMGWSLMDLWKIWYLPYFS